MHYEATQSDYGDFRVFFQHINEEPAMIFGAVRFDRRRAFVIPLSRAWEFNEDVEGDEELVLTATKIVDVLGIGSPKSRTTVSRVASAIMDNLEALIAMPPVDVEDTRDMVDRAVEAYGLSIAIDGKEIVG